MIKYYIFINICECMTMIYNATVEEKIEKSEN